MAATHQLRQNRAAGLNTEAGKATARAVTPAAQSTLARAERGTGRDRRAHTPQQPNKGEEDTKRESGTSRKQHGEGREEEEEEEQRRAHKGEEEKKQEDQEEPSLVSGACRTASARAPKELSDSFFLLAERLPEARERPRSKDIPRPGARLIRGCESEQCSRARKAHLVAAHTAPRREAPVVGGWPGQRAPTASTPRQEG
jgi:hypothetical protein